MYQKIRKYVAEDLWNFPLRQEKGCRHFFLKCLRIFVLAIRGFWQDECALHASSLTYYSIMALVPVLAMSFAIARGFGFQDYLRSQILEHFENNQDIFLEIFSFVENMIDQTKGGIIAGMGLVILFWSITQLLSNLERSMNQIWKVKQLRSWRRILTDYFALMLVGPCLLFLSTSASVVFVQTVEEGLKALQLKAFIYGMLLFIAQMVPYGLFWLLFAFIYLFMPNKKVPIASAVLGGIVGGTVYLVMQWGYIYFQVGFNRIGAIYGSFAAIPLFLIWLQFSWFALFWGAQISHAHQTLQMHEFEERAKQASPSYKRLLSLWIVHLAVTRFMKGQPLLKREELIVRYQIPYLLISVILNDVIAAGILLETEDGIVPAKNPENIRIADVISVLEMKGTSDFPFIDAKLLAPFERVLEAFWSQINTSVENRLISEIS